MKWRSTQHLTVFRYYLIFQHSTETIENKISLWLDQQRQLRWSLSRSYFLLRGGRCSPLFIRTSGWSPDHKKWKEAKRHTSIGYGKKTYKQTVDSMDCTPEKLEVHLFSEWALFWDLSKKVGMSKFRRMGCWWVKVGAVLGRTPCRGFEPIHLLVGIKILNCKTLSQFLTSCFQEAEAQDTIVYGWPECCLQNLPSR